MSYRLFFLAVLLLPIAVGTLGHFVSVLDGVYFLWQFAAIPYAVTAILIAIFLWRARTLRQIVVLSVCAPLLMSGLEVAFLAAIDPPELRGFGRILQLASVVPVTLAVAYTFVGMAWAIFGFARKAHWLETTPPNNRWKGP